MLLPTFYLSLLKQTSVQKKAIPKNGLSCSLINFLILKANCFRRTNSGASSTLSAGICVDRITIALRDGLYGALINTCSACNAVFTNYVCHNVFCLLLLKCFL